LIKTPLLLLVFAASILPLGADEGPPPLSIGLSPAISFPLGQDSAFFSMGGGADGMARTNLTPGFDTPTNDDVEGWSIGAHEDD